jgi:hypothetical protein
MFREPNAVFPVIIEVVCHWDLLGVSQSSTRSDRGTSDVRRMGKVIRACRRLCCSSFRWQVLLVCCFLAY